MLPVAIVILIVLLVLFGVCVFMFLNSEKEEEADQKPMEKERKVKKNVSEDTAEKPISENKENIKDDEDKFKTRVVTKAEMEKINEAELKPEPKAEEKADISVTKKIGTVKPENKAALNDQEDNGDSEEGGFNFMPVIIIGVAAVVVLSIVAFMLIRSDMKKRSDLEINEPETITAEIENIRQETAFTGTVTCENPDVRYFTAMGIIEEVKVKEGDKVKAGDTIYVINSENVESRIELLKERLENAKVTENSQVEERYELKSNVNGTVSSVNVSVGDTVSKGETIAVVSSPSAYRVSLEFEGSESGMIKNGDKAAVVSGGSTFDAVVSSVKEEAVENLDGGILYTYAVSVEFKGNASDGASAYATINGNKSIGNSAVRVESTTNVAVRSEHDGKVERVSVHNGSTVKNGAVIAVITNKSVVEEVKTDEFQAKDIQLQIEQLEVELENYTLKADKDGIVQKLYFKKGETAAVNSQAAIIVPEGEFYLKVDIKTEEASNIHVPAMVKYSIVKKPSSSIPEEAWENIDTEREYSSTVEFIEESETKGISTAHIPIEDQNGLFEGMKANVTITTYMAFDALLVPKEYIKNGKITLWRANKIEEVDVETGIVTDDGYVEIKSGMSSMDKIVTGEAEG